MAAVLGVVEVAGAFGELVLGAGAWHAFKFVLAGRSIMLGTALAAVISLLLIYRIVRVRVLAMMI